MRYVLITDGDGHWFVCPADRADEAAEIFDAIGRYWDDLDAPGDPPDDPDFVRAVGGSPSLVTFSDPHIDGLPLDGQGVAA